MKKTILIVSSSIVFILIFVMFLIAGTSIIGFKPYRHSNGSILYITETSNIDIKVNDIIFYYIDDREKTATCPVRKISYNENCFYTYKGDISYADNGGILIDKPMEQVPIKFDSVRGKVAFSLPFLGYLSEFLTSKTGFAIVLIITVLFSLLIAFSSFMPSNDKKHKRRSHYRVQIPSKENVVYEVISEDEELTILNNSKEMQNASEEKPDNTKTEDKQ